MDDSARRAIVEAALAKLDLDTKCGLLAGETMWKLPACAAIGLAPIVMSDGPIGVRGVRWSADDPSVALPSPTALGATWDPALAERAGALLAQEARRKGVHVLLAPTVNLHRSPLGGRHFESYSEDPFLTAELGTGYVRGVQSGGVATTVKHFVANDAETERFTVDNLVGPRALRELYLAPFEAIVKNAGAWGVMSAYNRVNGTSMTEHHQLQNEILRGEWGFDGFVVSDWTGARSTVGAITGGTDVAMPGPGTVYGPALAAAVRAGEVEERVVDDAVRRVLLLASRVGALAGAEPTEPPAGIDGDALAREVAQRSFVLVRNENQALPLTGVRSVAVLGAAARDARVLGGGSAEVFPDHVVSPLDGLTAALPEGTVRYAVGADPSGELASAGAGFQLEAVCRGEDDQVLGGTPLPNGSVLWMGADSMPRDVDYDELHAVEITGTFVPRESGEHAFGTRGLGAHRLVVGSEVLFDGVHELPEGADFMEAIFGAPVQRGSVNLEAGKAIQVSLTYVVPKYDGPIKVVAFALAHSGPQRTSDELIAEAVEVARAADAAIVVVATTERVESEGFDRTSLALPGTQDELVRAVAAVNPRTVVVVNAGAPVELPWRDSVAAVLLTWFPGQEGGAALADVLLGSAEPGGRLPTTWPAVLADAPVTQVTPRNGQLAYDEGVFIGYRAWERAGRTPAYPFGHGLGYTDWEYEAILVSPTVARVRIRNLGSRPGREVVQVYVAPVDDSAERPARWLAGFASVEVDPSESAEVEVALPERAFQIWDEQFASWRLVPGAYEVQAGRSIADCRLTAPLQIG
ncbi:beta-glucosidase H [Tenggerimyces flavus]|uniref:Glycoside hydrolase family 3 C-terminal domain-containing protein n=1 Tax=Tenggerimyces flavus TaxID=1708749 RepID=A0ABV7Y2E8_9ACTN|nr:glycoside hydrolase family 3 C-terminal domain-containing protein [Tenggerimyces flavus]MBM7790794.1 beta-glucosidase [Tenggerimyces flavus]